jgi:hypothetical protein
MQKGMTGMATLKVSWKYLAFVADSVWETTAFPRNDLLIDTNALVLNLCNAHYR